MLLIYWLLIHTLSVIYAIFVSYVSKYISKIIMIDLS